MLALIAANRLGVRGLGIYAALGAVLWYFVHESGVHATVAGVITAFAVPTRTRIDAAQFSADARSILDEFDRAETGDLLVITSKGQQEALHALESASDGVTAPLLRLEHALHRTSAFVVMPVFALANAGVGAGLRRARLARRPPPSASACVLGKPLGITAAAWLACRAGWASLPPGVTWPMLHGCAWIAGIGFTMSLFIAALGLRRVAAIRRRADRHRRRIGGRRPRRRGDPAPSVSGPRRRMIAPRLARRTYLEPV